MKAKLLVSTAVILTGFAFASAQEMPRGKSEGPPANQGTQGGPRSETPRQGMPERDAQGQRGQREQGKGKQAQPKPDRDRSPRTTGQGGQEQREQGKAKQAQPKPDRDRGPRTTGQGERDKQEKAKQARPKTDRDQRDKGKQAQPKPDRDQQQTTGQGQRDPGRDQTRRDDRAEPKGRVNVSAEQRTRIRETVLSRRDVPRVNNVNFSVRVGTVVPTRIRVVAVPPVIVEYWPEYRDNVYFVVRDEIVILDDRRRIVAVIPVETAGTGGGRGSAQVFVDLSPDEIREVQRVLVERGFRVQVDGVFGPGTRRALIQFQQRQGLQATGRIDSRTIAELGVSIRSEGGEGRTTGQGDDRRGGGAAQQPGAGGTQQSPMGQQQSPAAQPQGQRETAPTTGQGSGPAERTPGQGAGGGG
ncbi:MAG: peptidoglycan-binding protein [Hyphomicrobiales bacterium]|nr:peptidoglycan-binding protein [Hyphomicrobiales bacterium]